MLMLCPCAWKSKKCRINLTGTLTFEFDHVSWLYFSQLHETSVSSQSSQPVSIICATMQIKPATT